MKQRDKGKDERKNKMKEKSTVYPNLKTVM